MKCIFGKIIPLCLSFFLFVFLGWSPAQAESQSTDVLGIHILNVNEIKQFRQVFTDDDVDYSESFIGLHARHEREEREFFARLLKKTGSLSACARALQMPKATLHNRIKNLGIKI